MSFDEYSELSEIGYVGGSTKEQKTPEEEFFHSCYVSGKTRTNHINIKERAGMFQIRGVEYNLETVHMIITHTKEVLANIKSEKGKDTTLCFSFKEASPPWHGTSTLSDGNYRQCPQTSPERAVNDFCCNCRAQILLAGIYCKESGEPILDNENKPIFLFIRGKGMRYKNVSEYLSNLFNEDLDPIFTPVTEESRMFEKSVVNNKRFVTEITSDEEESSFGNTVSVFILKKGTELPEDSVKSILKLSKKTVKQFTEKFDWSKKKQTISSTESKQKEGILTTESESTQPNKKSSEEKASEAGVKKSSGTGFSFDEIAF